jgi:hypothetical protein
MPPPENITHKWLVGIALDATNLLKMPDNCKIPKKPKN